MADKANNTDIWGTEEGSPMYGIPPEGDERWLNGEYGVKNPDHPFWSTPAPSDDTTPGAPNK